MGYLPSDTKVAVAFSNDDISAVNFALIDAATGETVFGPRSMGPDSGSYCAFSHTYRPDFSAFTGCGSFKISLADGSAESSYFTISPDVYRGTQEEILSYLRSQRCGDNPFLSAVCHTHPESATDGDAWKVDTGGFIDLSGGWHDAADYIKFLLTVSDVLDLTLFTYRENRGKFADNYLSDGTPGSNGIPDILDEAKYGLDWVLKLKSVPGKLYYQVGGEADHYSGWRLPQDDNTDYGYAGYRPAYQGIGANIAGRSAAAFAMAYLIWKNDLGDDAYAAACWSAATELYSLAWSNLTARDTDPSWFYDETFFYDDLELAGVEMYKASGEFNYLTEAIYCSSLAGSSWGWFDWGNIHSLAHYELYPHADYATQSQLQTYLQQDLDSNLSRALSNPFRVSTTYGWGSAAVMTGTVVMCDFYKKLFPGETAYDALHDEVRDYILGRNQWGVSWVTGLGDNYTRDPHSQVADITGTAIYGTCIEGPMARSTWNAMGISLKDPDEYAAFQSGTAVYHDDVNDWATNEPTIWQASLTLCMLSDQAPASPTPSCSPVPVPSCSLPPSPSCSPTPTPAPSCSLTPPPAPSSSPTPPPSCSPTPPVIPAGTTTPSPSPSAPASATPTLPPTATPSPVPTYSCIPIGPGVGPAQVTLTDDVPLAMVTYGCNWCIDICSWTVTTKPEWVDAEPDSGSGPGYTQYPVMLSAGNVSSLPYGVTSDRVWFHCEVCSGPEADSSVLVSYYKIDPNLMAHSGDYDGDGSAEIAVFRPATGLWAIRGLSRFYFGENGDIPVPGDYDGDARSEAAVFRENSGLWSVRGLTRAYLGRDDDIPAPGDYDGDEICEFAVFRETTGLWAVRGVTRCYFGRPGDLPVAGDYAGEGTEAIAVFRSAGGLWAVRSDSRIYFGREGDRAVPGDYTGSGNSTVGIFRPSSGLWAIRGVTRSYFGRTGDRPSPADYDGAALDRFGIFRGLSGLWAIKGRSRVYFGSSGDIPVTR